ncbi:MAG: protein kinase [Candidatus Schekmanbacteria bacterium]|nr:protein kinase [Candidatus Schekmanbacteria bacterium]
MDTAEPLKNTSQRPADDTVPEQIGPFLIAKLLGRGASGLIYEARHAVTGEIAAVKVLHALKEGRIEALRRELAVLARLDHPGVVRVLASGVRDGLPWFAMERVEGEDLRAHCRRLWDPTASPGAPEPEALRLILATLRRLALVLAFVHGEGIVHRDLKPENILVRPSGFPVLVDFGLHLRFGRETYREALAEDQEAAGTLLFMSPEQLRGEPADARSDLYSLGCVIYEIFTGHPPFLGPTVRHVIQGHLFDAPLPPSRDHPGCPAVLDQLILRLLAKEPGARLGHAAALAEQLVLAGWLDPEPAWSRPVTVCPIYRPALVGRIQTVQTVLERLRAGRPGEQAGQARPATELLLLLIGGESGIGKTRVLMEVARAARRLRYRILRGECLPPADHPADARQAAGGGALYPFAGMLREMADQCLEAGEREIARLFGDDLALLLPYSAALAELVCPGAAAIAQRAELLPPEVRKRQLFSALLRAINALAGDRAPLVIIDDLQWADELTLELLTAVASGDFAAAAPAFLGAYRAEEAGPLLAACLSAAGAHVLTLERLSPADIESMTAEMLGTAAPPPELTRFLAEAANGNPFFAAELLRNVIMAGIFRADVNGRWERAAETAGESADPRLAGELSCLPVPKSVEEVIAARVSRLSPRAREVIDVAALVGRHLRWPILELALPHLATVRSAVTAELLARHVVEESETSGGLQFAHDRICEVVQARLDPARRAALHRQVALALESDASTSDRVPELAADLARHWRAAAAPEQAARYALIAARHAVTLSALAAAEEHFKHFLALCDELGEAWRTAAGHGGHVTAAARYELAQDVLRAQGRAADAAAELEIARSELAATPGSSESALNAQILLGLAAARREIGDPHAAIPHVAAAETTFRELGDRVGAARARAETAAIHKALGHIPAAAEHFSRAAAAFRLAGERGGEALALTNLAGILASQGQEAAAESAFAAAISAHRAAGNRRAEAVALGILGSARMHVARLEDAERALTAALEILRDLGDRRNEACFLTELGVLRRLQGRHDEASATLLAALSRHRQLANRQFESIALGHLGVLHLELGKATEAKVALTAARELQRAIGDRYSEAFTAVELARAERLIGGSITAGRAHIDFAETVYTEAGSPLGLISCACERAYLEIAAGGTGEAFRERARALASAHGVTADSDTGRELLRMEEAVAAASERDPGCGLSDSAGGYPAEGRL